MLSRVSRRWSLFMRHLLPVLLVTGHLPVATMGLCRGRRSNATLHFQRLLCRVAVSSAGAIPACRILLHPIGPGQGSSLRRLTAQRSGSVAQGQPSIVQVQPRKTSDGQR